MQKQSNNQKPVFIKKEDEKILVISRNIFFEQKEINGIEKVDFEYYQKLIQDNKEFLWRSKMETDPSYKQIIPYLVFNFEDKYFLMQRKSNANEVRLQNKYSLGIGGHIRQEDINSFDIADWAKREFTEEINYSGNLEIEPIGILNDDSNNVGKVHTGFVFLLKGNSNQIKVRSELKSGTLLTLKELSEYYENMENWSKLVFDLLNQ
jgi:predicted NUDIX family phosphoesterase